MYMLKELVSFESTLIIYIINYLKISGKIQDFDWKKCKCSCIDFYKNYVCKHIIALGYTYKQIEIDSIALDAVAIGNKPKRGRKRKVGSAWLVE